MPGIIVNLGHPGFIRAGAWKMSGDDLPADPAGGFENRNIAFSSGFRLKMPRGEKPTRATANYRDLDFLFSRTPQHTIWLNNITLRLHRRAPLFDIERIDTTHRNSPTRYRKRQVFDQTR